MALRGNIETFYLASILQLLCNDRKTGVLRLKSGNKKVEVFFKEGQIVHATGSEKDMRLGHLLRTQGVLSGEDLQKMVELAAESNESLGRILVKKGYISSDALKKFVQHHVKEILYSLFLWKKGEFEYVDQPVDLGKECLTDINPMEIILEATRRIDEWSILQKHIPNNQVVFKLCDQLEGKSEEIKLNANEWRILSLVDGNRTLEQVVQDSGYDEFAVYKIIHSLIASGLIEKSDEVAAGDQGGAIDYTGIITVYNDILEIMHENMVEDIGVRFYAFFDQAVRKLPKEGKALLKGYDFSAGSKVNIQRISDYVSSLESFEEGKKLIFDTFNTLFRNLIDLELEVLGMKAVEKTIKEIETTLAYVKKYQKSSSLKLQVVSEITKILVNFRKRTPVSINAKPMKNSNESKKKKRGLFSFIKK